MAYCTLNVEQVYMYVGNLKLTLNEKPVVIASESFGPQTNLP